MSLALLQLSLRDEKMVVQNGQVIFPGSHSIGRSLPDFRHRQLGSRAHMLITRLYCCFKNDSACEGEHKEDKVEAWRGARRGLK